MSEPQAVSIQPHAEAVWAVIHHHTLDEATIERMHTEIAAAAAQKASLPVILDMSNVQFIPSTGLGAYIALRRLDPFDLRPEPQRMFLDQMPGRDGDDEGQRQADQDVQIPMLNRRAKRRNASAVPYSRNSPSTSCKSARPRSAGVGARLGGRS